MTSPPLWKTLHVLNDAPTRLRVLVKERTRGPITFSLAVGRADPENDDRTMMFLQFGGDDVELQPLRNAMDRLLCEAEEIMTKRMAASHTPVSTKKTG